MIWRVRQIRNILGVFQQAALGRQQRILDSLTLCLLQFAEDGPLVSHNSARDRVVAELVHMYRILRRVGLILRMLDLGDPEGGDRLRHEVAIAGA